MHILSDQDANLEQNNSIINVFLNARKVQRYKNKISPADERGDQTKNKHDTYIFNIIRTLN